MPIVLFHDLTGGDLVLFPRAPRIGNENRILICEQRIRCPETVTPRLTAFAEPERGVVIRMLWVSDPSAAFKTSGCGAGEAAKAAGADKSAARKHTTFMGWNVPRRRGAMPVHSPTLELGHSARLRAGLKRRLGNMSHWHGRWGQMRCGTREIAPISCRSGWRLAGTGDAERTSIPLHPR